MDGAGLSAEDYESLRLGHIAELDDLKANLVSGSCRLVVVNVSDDVDVDDVGNEKR
jgi:hypothetical protein